MNGWIKLHRKFLESPVWKYAIQTNYPVLLQVWFYLLLNVNFEEKKWYDGTTEQTISPGSLITSIVHISEFFGISRQTVRTCITHLVNMKMITIKTTNKWTQIYVQNWEKYQNDNQPTNQRATNEQPTSNQPLDTTKEYKNIRNKEEDDDQQKIPNRLNLSKGQLIAYAKEYQGLTTTEIGEQRIKCNSYMNMSSDTFSNPGLFFRNWLKRYSEEKKLAAHKAELSKQPKQDTTNIPDISEEQRLKNIARIAEIKRKLVNEI